MRALMFMAILLASFSAVAEYTCVGKVKNLNQGRSGTISLISPEIYGNSVGRKICSVTEIWNNVDPAVCKAWLSKLLTAKASDISIVVQYDDNTSCTSHPTWSSAYAPYAFWEAE